MNAAPRRSWPLALAVLVSGLALAVPAMAAGPASAAVASAWVLAGLALGVGLAMAACWTVMGERLGPREGWGLQAAAALLLLLATVFLAADYPLWLALAGVAVTVWGLWLVRSLSANMGHLLLERDHARAEATRVKADSERDPLTGVLNRGAWRARLERLAEDTQQDQRALSVLFFDIDLFKLINDSLGHQVGDDCLKAVANAVAAELRGGDILGRLGGEEFAVALPGAKRIHALAVGERVRTAVQQHCRSVGEEVVELTVSVGAAEHLGPDESLDALVDRADRAMYTAKDSGRNMVVADANVPADHAQD
ncbi:MAG TPA: GGDEF domain-containing protein [Arenimonas sp.]|nr:GGDEF domain-containing protein [Arenimonas sp.]